MAQSSRTWMETLTDFIPRWPKRYRVDSEVAINRNTEKPRKANLSAPLPEPEDQFHLAPENSGSFIAKPGEKIRHSNKPQLDFTPSMHDLELPRLDFGGGNRAMVGNAHSTERTPGLVGDVETPGVRRESPNTAYREQNRPFRANEPNVARGYQQANSFRQYEDEYRPQETFGYDPSVRVVRRQKEPDKFDETKVEWSDYLRHFETVAHWNQWNYREMGMQLAMSLKDDAQRIAADTQESTGYIDYNTLVKELNHRYNPAEREFTHRVEFRSRVKRSSETTTQFGYALRRLALKAFPNISRVCQEQLVLDQFVTGLGGTDLKRHVQFGHPQDLNKAIALATEYESFEQKSSFRSTKPQNANVMSVNPEENVSVKEFRALCATIEQNTRELNSLKHGLSRENRDQAPVARRPNGAFRCYFCNMEGHMQRNCPRRVEIPAGNGAASGAHTNGKNDRSGDLNGDRLRSRSDSQPGRQ